MNREKSSCEVDVWEVDEWDVVREGRAREIVAGGRSAVVSERVMLSGWQMKEFHRILWGF